MVRFLIRTTVVHRRSQRIEPWFSHRGGVSPDGRILPMNHGCARQYPMPTKSSAREPAECDGVRRPNFRGQMIVRGHSSRGDDRAMMSGLCVFPSCAHLIPSRWAIRPLEIGERVRVDSPLPGPLRIDGFHGLGRLTTSVHSCRRGLLSGDRGGVCASSTIPSVSPRVAACDGSPLPEPKHATTSDVMAPGRSNATR